MIPMESPLSHSARQGRTPTEPTALDCSAPAATHLAAPDDVEPHAGFAELLEGEYEAQVASETDGTVAIVANTAHKHSALPPEALTPKDAVTFPDNHSQSIGVNSTSPQAAASARPRVEPETVESTSEAVELRADAKASSRGIGETATEHLSKEVPASEENRSQSLASKRLDPAPAQLITANMGEKAQPFERLPPTLLHGVAATPQQGGQKLNESAQSPLKGERNAAVTGVPVKPALATHVPDLPRQSGTKQVPHVPAPSSLIETMLPQPLPALQTSPQFPAFELSNVGGPEIAARSLLEASTTRMDAARPVTATTPESRSMVSQVAAAIVKAEGGKLDIRLDPPELGRLSVTISNADDVVSAVVAADRAETQDLLRRHADLLQRALRDAGFADVTLDFSASSDRGADGENPEGLPSANGLPDDQSAKTTPYTFHAASSGLDIRL